MKALKITPRFGEQCLYLSYARHLIRRQCIQVGQQAVHASRPHDYTRAVSKDTPKPSRFGIRADALDNTFPTKPRWRGARLRWPRTDGPPETFVRKVIHTGVDEDSQNCFHEVTLYDPYPKRKVSSVIVGSIEITLQSEELWLNQADLRVVKKRWDRTRWRLESGSRQVDSRVAMLSLLALKPVPAATTLRIQQGSLSRVATHPTQDFPNYFGDCVSGSDLFERWISRRALGQPMGERLEIIQTCGTDLRADPRRGNSKKPLRITRQTAAGHGR